MTRSLTIIKVHLIQLLWLLFDADSQRWWTTVPCPQTFGTSVCSWAAAATGPGAVARGHSEAAWGRGLRGWGGSRAAGWVKAQGLITSRCLLDDGDMLHQLLPLGACAWRGQGSQCGRVGCRYLLAGGAHPTRPGVRGHQCTHDLGREVWLWTVLSAHHRDVNVIMWLCLNCWD